MRTTFRDDALIATDICKRLECYIALVLAQAVPGVVHSTPQRV